MSRQGEVIILAERESMGRWPSQSKRAIRKGKTRRKKNEKKCTRNGRVQKKDVGIVFLCGFVERAGMMLACSSSIICSPSMSLVFAVAGSPRPWWMD